MIVSLPGNEIIKRKYVEYLLYDLTQLEKTETSQVKENIQNFKKQLQERFDIRNNQSSQPPPSGGGKNVKSIIVYKTKGGHYYRKYKNGNKKRISFEKYKKLK